MANIIDFTAITALLEKDIKPAINDQLYKKSALWQLFGGWDAGQQVAHRSNTPAISFQNNTIYVDIMTGRPTTGAIGISEQFQYGVTNYNQGNLSIAVETGAFQMPKAVLNIKNGGSIVNNLQNQIMQTVNATSMDMNRQCYSDGTATLAYASGSGSSATTINLKPKAAASTFYNNDIPLAVRYFTVGMLIKVASNAITSVTAITGNNQITVADAQTFSNNDAIVKQSGSSTTASEMTGLASMVNTGTSYMGVDGATVAPWNAYVDTNNGVAKAFDVKDVNKGFLSVNAIGNASIILMNQTEFEKYGESLTDQVRFSKTDVLSGGWIGLDYMGGNATVILDYDCPDDRIYILSPEYLFRADFQDFEWEPGTLQNGMRITQKLVYEFVADWMGNVGTVLRAGHGVLTNRVG